MMIQFTGLTINSATIHPIVLLDEQGSQLAGVSAGIPLELECGDPKNVQELKLFLPADLAREFLEHLSQRLQELDSLHGSSKH